MNKTYQVVLLLAMAGLMAITSMAAAADKASDELVFAFHVTISPAWFDLANTPAQVTP